jgi:anti-sigma B factor antagonist
VKLSIRTETREDAVVVHVGGDLDVYTAPRLKETLAKALGVLVSAHEQSQAADGDLRLVMDDPYLLKIFHITGFDGMFSIYPEVTGATSSD